MIRIMLLQFLFVLLGVVLINVAHVQTQDQSGFISIDCGLAESSSYADRTTGINYISDAKFIDTGEVKSLSPYIKSTARRELWYVRSFPTGVRNCYRINVTSGAKYLIRTTFFYANYDGLNEVPQFDLHLGANRWATVKLSNNQTLSSYYEIIYSPSLDYMHICLVNTRQGTPFISILELRTLNNNTYDTKSGSLAHLSRYDLGNSELRYRYKDDVYDRIWLPYPPDKRWTQLNASLTNENLSQTAYKPPAVVMSTAATPINASASFDFHWDDDNLLDAQYYVCMHFTEVQKLAPNETRSFDITLNGDHWYGPLVPLYQKTTTIYSTSAFTGGSGTGFQFSLIKTENSTLPPIINGVEIYMVIDLSHSETEQDDVDAIINIKKAYGVDRNWQGDPCTPRAYMWEGLNCSSDDNNPPRITSLNLSSSGLIGQISSYISKLTMLEYLDLSNNSLSGSVPDFLTELQSLKVLNLGSNNLAGLVPSGLVDRSSNGSLSLRYAYGLKT
ncbi:hypothetical protein RIF29_28920 [Crotalaria pallida]|uniref:Malectin-like domain-containing protein n=1 Tax=Crotalaria pallida TaxID=3830 RepID=A0AAN9EDN2_CROPI